MTDRGSSTNHGDYVADRGIRSNRLRTRGLLLVMAAATSSLSFTTLLALRNMTITLKYPVKQNELSKLVGLIASATQIVEAYYEASYVPRLDETEPHPLDDEVSPPSVRKAIQTIEAACSQLCTTITKPKLAIVNVSRFLCILDGIN